MFINFAKKSSKKISSHHPHTRNVGVMTAEVAKNLAGWQARQKLKSSDRTLKIFAKKSTKKIGGHPREG